MRRRPIDARAVSMTKGKYDRRMPIRRSLVALLVLVAAVTISRAQQPAPGFADPVLGRWDITVQGAQGPYPSWVEVMLRKETELMARFVGRVGSNRHASEVTYRDGELTVRIPVQYEANKSDLVFKGRIVGNQLEGTTEDERGTTVKWTATRAPVLQRSAQPKWGTPIELVNGKDLSGWRLRETTRGRCWQVADGALTNTPPCIDLISERAFTDFKLHVEFNIVPKSNSGIYLRGRYEVQIQDDEGRVPDSLRMGGVYGFLRPAATAALAPGEWQTYDISLVGRRVTVVLNRRTLIEDSEIPGITGGALDSNEGAPGPILLQGDHGKVAFRRVTVTPGE
jgi:hypothetical protein